MRNKARIFEHILSDFQTKDFNNKNKIALT